MAGAATGCGGIFGGSLTGARKGINHKSYCRMKLDGGDFNWLEREMLFWSREGKKGIVLNCFPTNRVCSFQSVGTLYLR